MAKNQKYSGGTGLKSAKSSEPITFGPVDGLGDSRSGDFGMRGGKG